MGITSVAGVPVQPQHRATCHCGTVELLLDLPDGIVDPRRCDCSMCRRRGAIAASVPARACRWYAGSITCRSTSSTPMWPSTTSAACAASTPITGAAPTPTSTATTWPAWRASTRSRWGDPGQRWGQPPIRPHRLVARAPRRRGHLLPGRHAAAPPAPGVSARAGVTVPVARPRPGRKGSTAGPEMVEQPHGGSPWGTGTINTRPGWA